ncbi:MAG: hypothetical protein KJ065_14990 [Anaerolineae bacterium]|nr:hypothetical protein [Anaerolineae bacterium]
MSLKDEQAAITQDFEKSWSGMLRFFAYRVFLYDYIFLLPILKLIVVLTFSEEHYRTYQMRAGQSLDSLMLSRSRNHGLRQDQARLRIAATGDGKFVLSFFDGETLTETVVDDLLEGAIEIVPPLKGFIDRLLQCPID